MAEEESAANAASATMQDSSSAGESSAAVLAVDIDNNAPVVPVGLPDHIARREIAQLRSRLAARHRVGGRM